MKLHESLTVERVVDAVEQCQVSLDDLGFCVACGEEAYGCESDAEHYPCESCGERQVFGAEELLLYVVA